MTERMRSNTPSYHGITPKLKAQIGISFQTLDPLRTQPHVPKICLRRGTALRPVDLFLTPRGLLLDGRQPASPSLPEDWTESDVLAGAHPRTVRVSTCDSSGTHLPLATGKGRRSGVLRQKGRSKGQIRMRPSLKGNSIAQSLPVTPSSSADTPYAKPAPGFSRQNPGVDWHFQKPGS
jgi:hypothetical protein